MQQTPHRFCPSTTSHLINTPGHFYLARHHLWDYNHKGTSPYHKGVAKNNGCLKGDFEPPPPLFYNQGLKYPPLWCQNSPPLLNELFPPQVLPPQVVAQHSFFMRPHNILDRPPCVRQKKKTPPKIRRPTYSS